jgi:hypothetical protein
VPASAPDSHKSCPRGSFRRRLPEDVQDDVAASVLRAAEAVSTGDEESTQAHLAKAAIAIDGVARRAS